MIIEICYTYQESKDSTLQTSWTYYNIDTDDFTKAKKKATSHFKSFVTANGWARKAKLKEIKQIRKAVTKVPVVKTKPKPNSQRKTRRKKP